VYALQNDFHTRSLDIVAAFMIGKRNPLYVRAPIEWHDLFLESLQTLNPQERAWYKRFKEIFRLDGTLYGRRAAGSVYGNELEEILCSRVNKKHTAAVCCNGRAAFFVIRKNSSGMSFASFGPSPALALFRNGVVQNLHH
jgi:hypothetical protein